jgi:hypothetical protein
VAAPCVPPRCPRVGAALLAAVLLTAGCAGTHRGPRILAGIGALAVTAGSGTWAAGEAVASDTTSRQLVAAGFTSVALGLCAIVIAGGWMAASVACEADPDCPDEEQCREVPAPPGGVPYKQCVPR